MDNESTPEFIKSIAGDTGKLLEITICWLFQSVFARTCVAVSWCAVKEQILIKNNLYITKYVLCSSDIAEYVNASFETNPLDGKCDQRIRLTVQPLEVIYHAVGLAQTIVYRFATRD